MTGLRAAWIAKWRLICSEASCLIDFRRQSLDRMKSAHRYGQTVDKLFNQSCEVSECHGWISKFFTFKLGFRFWSAAPKVAEAFKSKLKQLVDSQKHNILLQKLLNPVNNTQGTSSQTDGGAKKEGYSGKGPERKVKPRKSAHIC